MTNQPITNDKILCEVIFNASHIVITEVRSFIYGHELDKYAKILNSKKHGKPRGTNGDKKSTF